MFYVQYLVTDKSKGYFAIRSCVVNRSSKALAWVALLSHYSGSGFSLVRMMVQKATPKQCGSSKLKFIK